ncbi:MAG: HK97 gp10 family phage protein [Butyricicoccaceae bacterium]
MSKTSIDRLSAQVMGALYEYAEITDEVVREAVTSVAKEAKEIAQSGAPVRTGEYKRGFSVKKTTETGGKLVLTVHNRRKPSLTHLLEKGHAKRGGGRVEGRPHIAPAEEFAISELEERIRRGLGR